MKPPAKNTCWNILSWLILEALRARLSPDLVHVTNQFLHFLYSCEVFISDCLYFKTHRVFMICCLCGKIWKEWVKILLERNKLERRVSTKQWSLPKGGQSNWPICQACIELEGSIPQLHRMLAIHLMACCYWRHRFHKLPMSKTISSTK